MASIQKTTAKITLDLYAKNVVSVAAKQYDDETRYIEITCVENGVIFTVDKTIMSAFIRLKKPDDKGVFNEVEITSDGKLKIELTEQMLSASGRAIADVFLLRKVFTSEEKPTNIDDIYKVNAPIISIMDFYINITPTALNHSQIESSYEFNALTNALAQIDFNNKKVVELDKTLTANENVRNNNEVIRQDNEQNRVKAENTRIESEKQRINSENTRISNEQQRITSENTRKSNEDTRISNEEKRKSNEDTRISNEEKRKSNESQRQTNENNRVSCENQRATSESNRQSNESNRQTNENARQANESTRQQNESNRQTNENERISNENTRINAENERIKNENIRISNENTRKTQETQRQNDTATAIANANNAAKNANDKATDLQNKLDNHHFVLTNELQDSVSSTSTIYAPTANAVKTAYDKAASVENTINSNKNNWSDKYTKNEIDNKFSALENNIDWKESVATFDDIEKTYPNAEDGWTVNVKDTDYTYRYSGSKWVAISANAIPKATQTVDGLLSKEDKINYDDANTKKHTHSNKSVLDGITSTLVDKWNKVTDKLDKTGDASNVTSTITTAATRTNLTTGEKLSASLGKISKWFSDLKPVSFTGSYNDLNDKPAINNGTITIKQAGSNKGTFTLNQSGDATIELTDNNTTYSNATTSTAGLMSPDDKTILNNLKTGVVTGVKGNSETTYRTGNVNLTPEDIGAVSIEDFNNLQIGGTNLLHYSGNFDNLTNSQIASAWSSNGGGLIVPDLSSANYSGKKVLQTNLGNGIVGGWHRLDISKTYTYSAYIFSNQILNTNSAHSIPLHYWCSTDGKTNNSNITILDSQQNITKINTWTLLYLTFKPNSPYFKPFVFMGTNTSANVYIAYLKLEEGNKPTAWSPNPEDVDASISSIDSKVTSLSTDLSGFKNTVNSTYITKTEFNNLSISGTNLLKNSGGNLILSSAGGYRMDVTHETTTDFPSGDIAVIKCTTAGSGFYINGNGYNTDGKIKNGDTITISGYVYNSVDKGDLSINVEFGANHTWKHRPKFHPAWEYFEVTVTATKDVTPSTSAVAITFYMGYSVGEFSALSSIKVEKGNKATSWSPAPEDYLLYLSGGTLTGKILRYGGGSWISDRNNVAVFGANSTTGNYNCVVGQKTANGAWTIGNLGGNENLVFNYSTDSNVNNNTNSTSQIYLPNVSGTIITSASIGNQSVNYSNNAGKVNNHTINSDVPANAKFTDTNTWRGIQNNLTSDSTTDSLSAAQGKALKTLVDSKQASGYYCTSSMVSSGTIDDLYNTRKATTGGIGSIQLTKKSSGIGSEIPAGWYNYIYVPHRNGLIESDNHAYATIILCPLNFAGNSYIVRYTSSVIADVKAISINGHTHNYAGSSSAGGAATNSDKLDGFHASQSAGSKSTCTVTDANGYLNLNYINSNTANNENPSTISQIIVTNGSDNYYRKASLAHLKNKLGTITVGQKSGVTIGSYATAEGSDNQATGDYSHAEGSNTTASGVGSHAEGFATKASGNWSHAEGHYTTVSGNWSHAEGRFNVDSNNVVFTIGNGATPTIKSNAFSITFAGVVKAASTITASTTADYAEFFEWADNNPNHEDRVGYFVTLDGNKIRKANDNDDYILGIVSGEPFVLGNGDCDTWNGMYLHDEFRRTITEPAPKVELIKNEETNKMELKEIAGEYEGTRMKLNPDYDPTQTYISRFDRPEWDAVGMLGVLPVRHDGTAKVNGYVTVNKDGIATACEPSIPNSYRVIHENSNSVVEVIFR